MCSAIVWPSTRKEQNIRKSEKADAPNGSEGSKEMHNDKMEEVKKATFCNIQYNQLAPLLPNRTHKRTHTLKHGTVSVRYEVNFEFGPVNQLLSNSIRPTACPATGPFSVSPFAVPLHPAETNANDRAQAEDGRRMNTVSIPSDREHALHLIRYPPLRTIPADVTLREHYRLWSSMRYFYFSFVYLFLGPS